MTGRTPLLQIADLSIAFGTLRSPLLAVNGFHLEIAPAETVAIVGESGSGKSTVASAINGLLPSGAQVLSGSVCFDGKDILGADDRELSTVRGREIGWVPQDPMSNLDPLMRVGRQIAEALEAHGVTSGKATTQRVLDLLTMVGIPDSQRRSRQYPHEFSGGMRQRVLIAMAMSCSPRLLVADEPTSALDVTVQKRILDQLAELATSMGTAVVLITHDLAVAAERADRIVVMHRGVIVEQNTAEAIVTSPQHDYTRRLLAAVPSLSTRRKRRPVPTRDAAPLATVTNVRKVYRLRGDGGGQRRELIAVDGVSFHIGNGETVSIVGESGSGKSTIASLLLGLEPVDAGSVELAGQPVTSAWNRSMVAVRRNAQPVFQNPYASLDPRYTVLESIIEPLRVHQVGDPASRIARGLELLEQVALAPDVAGRRPHELSGGQQQRVAIARALALRPSLIVLDEAVSALDVIVQAQILGLIDRLQAELGLSYLFISHDLAVVRLISDRIYVMQAGRFVESGTPENIFNRPRTPYTRELLAAIPGRRLPVAATGSLQLPDPTPAPRSHR